MPVVLVSGARHGDDTGTTSSTSGNDANFRQLEELVASMRGRLAAAQLRADRDTVREEELRAAYALFVQIGGQCRALCHALVAADGPGGKTPPSTASSTGIDGVGIGLKGHGHVRRMTSAGGGGISKLEAGEGGGDEEVRPAPRTQTPRKQPLNSAWVAAVRDWRACLDELAAAHRLALTNTYKRHEQFATPEILDALFANRKSRAQVVSGWMKNFGAYKRMQGQSGVWSKWEAQFQNYEQVVHELAEVTCLLQGLDSSITPNRAVNEVTIAPRGDTVLEFANAAMDWKPVLRFRVSSHMLAETSPIFAAMFSSRHAGREPEDSNSSSPEPGQDVLPPPPTPFVCSDGARALLYRMPQLELDRESSLTILLHAAHMHNDRVPRDVSFEQFVALAQASLRYRCTSPLELFVEHRWLPQWVHKATDAMPDGLVVVSYVFGLRRLFTRVTKTAILNLVDENELEGKDWPRGIKERIWAVRCAKMAQVYGTCARAVEEYLRPPRHAAAPEVTEPDAMEGVTTGSQSPTPVGSPPRPMSGYAASTTPSIFSHGTTSTSSAVASLNSTLSSPRLFTTTPRCPKGSHWCDATNLGWLMLVYNELQILSTFLDPQTLSLGGHNTHPPPRRSLAQIVEALRAMNGPPPHPDHLHRSYSSGGVGGVCDPAPAFRAAINDVYNSVSGLTLFEIDGARHGWALSRHHAHEPQVVLRVGGVADSPAVRREEQSGGGVVDEELARAMGGLGLAEDEDGEVTVAIGLEISEAGGEEEERGPVPMGGGSAEEALRDEGICLRILAGVDAFPDLHSAAVINRTVYAVYKQNELELMRNVVRADRRRTASLLVGDKVDDGDAVSGQKSGRDPLSPGVDQFLRRLIHEGPKQQPQRSPSESGDDDDYVSVEPESDSAAETGISVASSSDVPPVRTESPAPSYSALSSGRSTRSTVNPYFKMTEEEARRILWPEPSPPLSPQLSTPEVRAFRAVSHHVVEDVKFAGSGTGTTLVEDKMLVTEANKQLREDMDRRIGLL